MVETASLHPLPHPPPLFEATADVSENVPIKYRTNRKKSGNRSQAPLPKKLIIFH